MKVLVATEKPFAPVAITGIREVVEREGGELLLLEKYTDRQQLLDAVAGVDALIVRSDKVDAAVLDAAKQLKIVVRAGAGYDNVDLAAATAHNVVVMNTPGQNSNAVAELVFGMLLMQVRRRFSGKAGTELKGKTIGLYTYGNVADNVARIAQGFGMHVVTYLYCCPIPVREGVECVSSPAELFEKSDIVSLHIPLTPDTREFVNRAMLERMKPDAILVNTARKEVVSEADLLARRSCRVRGQSAGPLFLDAQEDGCPDGGSQHQRRYRRRASSHGLPEERRRNVPRKPLNIYSSHRRGSSCVGTRAVPASSFCLS